MYINKDLCHYSRSNLAFGGETYAVKVDVTNFDEAAYGAVLKVDIPEGVKLRKVLEVKGSTVSIEDFTRCDVIALMRFIQFMPFFLIYLLQKCS